MGALTGDVASLRAKFSKLGRLFLQTGLL